MRKMGSGLILIAGIFCTLNISFADSAKDAILYLKDRVRTESPRERLMPGATNPSRDPKVEKAVPEAESILPPPADIEALRNEIQQVKSEAAQLKQAVDATQETSR